MTPDQIEAIARACHEANRAWCLLHGDASQVSWDDAPENIKESARSGVAIAAGGATPEQQHQAWCDFKVADGWTFGPVKDAAAKTHPCLVPYADLPPEQRAKDAVYIGVVRAFVEAIEG
jgi:hypothetical protein